MDRPIAVVDAVNTATPVTLMVHADHLNRPVRMTNSAKVSVWDVVYTPWGALHSATGAQTLNARFPGQWFQLESALHYNWHRHYDPSLGRYTQPDPLGFVDGPSVYAYAKSASNKFVDRDGRLVDELIEPWIFIVPPLLAVGKFCQDKLNEWLGSPPTASNENRPPPDPSEYCSLRPGSGQSVKGGVQCTYQCQGGTIVPQTQPGPLCFPIIKRPFWAN